MVSGRPGAVFDSLRMLFRVGTVTGLVDAELLERFVVRRDADAAEMAFKALVERHGPMVLRVCRDLLGDSHDAEDAFQAVFLVLAKKARSIRNPDLLAQWLYGVALRSARKARTRRARRLSEAREAAMSRLEPVGDPGRAERLVETRELVEALHEEIRRLPDKYQAPLVLCDLSGQTHAEAARRLRSPVGTISVRIARARELLRQRLTRRGMTLPAGIATAVLAREAVAAVPPALVESTVRSVILAATGRAAVASASAATLAQEVTTTMFLDTLKKAVVFLLALGLAAGVGMAALQTVVVDPPGMEKRKTPRKAPLAVRPAAEPPALATDRHGDPLPSGAVARLGTVRFRHKDQDISAVAFAPGGARVASAGGDRMVRIWETATGAQLASFGAPGVRALAFTPDGKALAAGTGPEFHTTERGRDTGWFTLRNAATGEEAWSIDKVEGGTWAVAFEPNGKHLATGGADDKIQLRDAATGKAVRTLSGHKGGVRTLAFSPDGKVLASGGGDGSARLHELATGEELLSWTPPADARESPILSVAYSANGNTLMAASSWQILVGGPAPDRNPVVIDMIKKTGRGCFAASLSADGDRVVSKHSDLIVEWDATTGRELRSFENPGVGGCLTLSPDGTTAVYGSSSDAALHLLDLATGQERPEGAHQADVSYVAFAPDGKTLASTGRDRTVRVWNVVTETQRHLLKWPGQDTRVVAFTPDGNVLAVGGPLYAEQLQATICLFDLSTGKQRFRIDAPGAWLGAVGFAPDSRTLGVFTSDRENHFHVSRWNTATGEKVGKVREIVFEGLTLPELPPNMYRTPPVEDVAFSPDLALLAVAAGGSIYLVDSTTGREVHRLKVTAGALPTHLAFSPDGRSLVSGAWDNAIRLWDVATGEQRRKLDGQPTQPNAVAFAPDGQRFAAGMGWLQAGAIRVWDAGTGEVLREIEGHGCFTGCLAFSPDGKLLASGLRDTTVVIWDLTRRDARQ